MTMVDVLEPVAEGRIGDDHVVRHTDVEGVCADDPKPLGLKFGTQKWVKFHDVEFVFWEPPPQDLGDIPFPGAWLNESVIRTDEKAVYKAIGDRGRGWVEVIRRLVRGV